MTRITGKGGDLLFPQVQFPTETKLSISNRFELPAPITFWGLFCLLVIKIYGIAGIAAFCYRGEADTGALAIPSS
ncbi:MAG: hypothetical protein C4530_12915 [Desulfobacteraceae bacterium]|nr:MAG: hypothetical protein C4530_12915 [Desulfobacteraceae bacterium]